MSGVIHDIDPTGDVILVLSSQRENRDTCLVPATPAQPPVKQESPESSTMLDNPVVGYLSSRAKYRVSSKHMILASRYMKRSLKRITGSDGKLPDPAEVTLLDCNQDALVIILNIIHGYNRGVPRSLDIKVLVNIANVVRYLECQEVVDTFAYIWLQKVREAQDPKAIVPDWVYASYVLGDSKAFQMATKSVQRHKSSSLHRFNPPIPSRIKRMPAIPFPNPHYRI